MAKEKKVKDATVSEEKVKKTKKQELEEVVEPKEKNVKNDEVTEDLDGLEIDSDNEKKEKNKNEDKAEKKKKKKNTKDKTIMSELKKVVWPKVSEVFKYTLAVLLFCICLVALFKGVELLAALLKELLS